MATTRMQLLLQWPCFCEVGRALSTCSCLFLPCRKTGRGVRSSFLCKDLFRLEECTKKRFTREWCKRFGYDSGIDDLKIILATQNPIKCRNLDPKKRSRLGALYKNAITDLLDQSDLLAKRQIIISKVDVLATFLEIRVHWLAKGDASDEETSSELEGLRGSLRKKLSEEFGNPSFPAVKFVMDDKHLLEEKMEKLFREADYGIQYRLVSQTAGLLGSIPENPRKEGTEKRLPWLRKKNAADKTKEN